METSFIRDFIRQEGIKERISVDRIDDRFKSTLINSRLLLLYMGFGENVEAHICSPRKNWRFIHQDLAAAINYLVKLGYTAIYTDVGHKFQSTKNLIQKHGFKIVESKAEGDIFKWV